MAGAVQHETRDMMTAAQRISFVALAAAMLGAHVHAQQVTLTETGSTLLAPLFETWSNAYAKVHPDVRISVGATGSQADGIFCDGRGKRIQ